jgi:hypothetical protein
MLIVGASDILFRAADILPIDFSAVPPGQRVAPKEVVLSFLVLGIGQEFPIAKFRRPLERDDGRVTPCALEVGVAPW